MIFGSPPKRRGLDFLADLEPDEPVESGSTAIRDLEGRLPLSTPRAGWWRDMAEGPRHWMRGVRAWAAAGSTGRQR